jgi:hypothetical protein
MVPPQFKNLSKSTKDLFKKGYDYKNEVKVTSNAGGVKLESGGYQCKGLVGYTKANFNMDYFGDVEIEVHSSGLAKKQFKLNNVTDGVNVTVAATGCGKLTVDSTYEKDMIAATFAAAHNLSKGSTDLSASAVFGMDGVSVGGSVNMSASNMGSPTDYNMGAEYKQSDLTASIVTSNKGEDLTASYFQKVCGKMQLGASMLVQPEAGTRLFTFGTNYVLDNATTIKAKADSCGIVATSVTHTLANPNMKLCVSSQFDALSSDCFSAQKFGVSVNLGEF